MDVTIWQGAAVTACMGITGWLASMAFKKPLTALVISRKLAFILLAIFSLYSSYIFGVLNGIWTSISTISDSSKKGLNPEVLNITSKLENKLWSNYLFNNFTFILLFLFTSAIVGVNWMCELFIKNKQKQSNDTDNEDNK